MQRVLSAHVQQYCGLLQQWAHKSLSLRQSFDRPARVGRLSVKCAVVASQSPECSVLESGWWKEAAECPFGHALVTAMHSAIVCMSLVFVYSLLDLYGRFNEHIHEGSKGHLAWARKQLEGDSSDGDTPAQSAGAVGGLWNPGAVPAQNVSEFSPLIK